MSPFRFVLAALSIPAVLAQGVIYGPGCNANNCLRAFDRFNGEAYCASVLADPLAPSIFPSYATQCVGNTASLVQSACTCLNYYYTAPPAVTTTALATLQTIVSSPNGNAAPSVTQVPGTGPAESDSPGGGPDGIPTGSGLATDVGPAPPQMTGAGQASNTPDCHAVYIRGAPPKPKAKRY